ncbi:MAG: hypothetical protein RR525_10165, partial [Cellulosilyticaceae bacterium]
FELVLREEDDNYFVTQVIYPSQEILSSDEVALYKKEDQEANNVAIVLSWKTYKNENDRGLGLKK